MMLMRRIAFTSLVVAAVSAQSKTGAANEAEIPVNESNFACILDMVQVRQFYVANLLGDLEASLEVANSPSGGKYPPGTLLQLVPTEAMVKHKPGWDAETNDWEFFFLDVQKGTTEIVTRGHEEVVNGNGGNCFACHQKARPEWDLTCETEHGCDPISLTNADIAEIQSNDPRCN